MHEHEDVLNEDEVEVPLSALKEMRMCGKTTCAWCWHYPIRWVAMLLFEHVRLGPLAPHVFGIMTCADSWSVVRVDEEDGR